MDAVIVRLVREAVAGDWEAVGLLLDRLEDMQDKRQEQLLAVLGSAKERIDNQNRGALRFPLEISRALGNVRSWLRTAFWAELLDGGPKALLATLAALEKEHGCEEEPHPQMATGTTYAYPMSMPANAEAVWEAAERVRGRRPAGLRRNLAEAMAQARADGASVPAVYALDPESERIADSLRQMRQEPLAPMPPEDG